MSSAQPSKIFQMTLSDSQMSVTAACPQLGPDKADLRRFHCTCTACNGAITQPVVSAIKDSTLQLQSKDPADFFCKPLLEDKSKWHFVDLKEKVGSDEGRMDEERQLVLSGVTASVLRRIL